MRRLVLAVTGFVAVSSVLTGPLAGPATSGVRTAGVAQPDTRPPGIPDNARVPGLRVTQVVGGLDIPWDVRPLPKGRLLVTERVRKRLSVVRHGKRRTVRFPSASVWASGETGLMSVAVDPAFSRNRRIYTCEGSFLGGGRHDVRVVAWTMGRRYRAVRFARTLISGLPATSGRHGGCRLLISTDGSMYVGTGDAATGTNPQNLGSLGGKTLRLNRVTGAPWRTNPFVSSANRAARYVHTYGHRNVQGLAQRSDGTVWSVEHGPTRDDEVNLLARGANYGWDPVGSGYDESVPMTDTTKYPSARRARWSSGAPTVATSGASWVSGAQWGDLNGALAVAELKGSRLRFLTFDAAGTLRRQTVTMAGFGRLRSVTRVGNGDLLVTTSNGGGRDRILRVHPVL